MIKETACYGEEYFAICERAKRKEIWIYSVSVGRDQAEWIVRWAERKEPVKQAVQQELFSVDISR